MNKFLFFVCIIFFNYSYAQQNKQTYYFNFNLDQVSKDSATIMGKGSADKENFRVNFYNINDNRLFMFMHFTDNSLNNLEGSFRTYYKNGSVESMGSYKDNVESGIWMGKDSFGNITDSSVYNAGVKIFHSEYYYDKNKIYSVRLTDTIKNTFQYISYDSIGNIKMEANFTGDDGVLTTFKNGIADTSKIYSRKIQEATCISFPNHLRKTLKSDVGMNNNAPMGTYTVIIAFKIDTLGNVYDIAPETNIGFGMEQEAMRVIEKSPKWQPAVFFGKTIVAIRRQPVTFMYTEDK